MAKRTPVLTVADTPQTPAWRYWVPSAAIPILPAALDRLGIRGDLEGAVSIAKLEAAYLTQLIAQAEDMTDGRKAVMINMISDFQRMCLTRLRAVQDEAAAKAGTSNSPFDTGRVLSR